MIFDTIYYELLLKIRTVGQDYRRRDDRNFGYDPTPYSVLSKLAASGYIKENDTLIDYGCGKGRVGFFMAHKCHCKVIGIDYNEAILKIALDNKERNGSENVTFIQGKAQDYKVTEADCAFFFNPFPTHHGFLRFIIHPTFYLSCRFLSMNATASRFQITLRKTLS